jgi:hypothetical protein
MAGKLESTMALQATVPRIMLHAVSQVLQWNVTVHLKQTVNRSAFFLIQVNFTLFYFEDTKNTQTYQYETVIIFERFNFSVFKRELQRKEK